MVTCVIAIDPCLYPKPTFTLAFWACRLLAKLLKSSPERAALLRAAILPSQEQLQHTSIWEVTSYLFAPGSHRYTGGTNLQAGNLYPFGGHGNLSQFVPKPRCHFVLSLHDCHSVPIWKGGNGHSCQSCPNWCPCPGLPKCSVTHVVQYGTTHCQTTVQGWPTHGHLLCQWAPQSYRGNSLIHNGTGRDTHCHPWKLPKHSL